MQNNQLAVVNQSEMISAAKLFAESGMFPNVTTMARAYVKMQAGAEIGIPAFAAMSGIHIIKEKAQIGAGLMAGKIKSSGKYNYKIIEQTDKVCSIDFYENGELQGNVKFTIEMAKKAGTQNLDKFPENMLFARCISNGTKFYCPDLYTMPVYVEGELGTADDEPKAPVDITHEEMPPATDAPVEAKPLPAITAKGFTTAHDRVKAGEVEVFDKVLNTYTLTGPQREALDKALMEGQSKLQSK